MCKSMEETVDERQKMKAAQMALKMLKDGELTFEKISEYSDLTVEEITELAKDYNLMPV